MLLADNAALAEVLESTQAALSELGAEHQAAVVAAQAGALCAEAEVARARDAAGHMMQLADQIQGMFALCEVGGLGVPGRQAGQVLLGGMTRSWAGTGCTCHTAMSHCHVTCHSKLVFFLHPPPNLKVSASPELLHQTCLPAPPLS